MIPDHKLDAKDLHQMTMTTLTDNLSIKIEGYACDTKMVLNVVTKAALDNSSIEAVCEDLEAVVDGNTLREHLNEALNVTEIARQEVEMNATLAAGLPDELPPSDKMLTSPYDPDARYSHKRLTTWIGYKVHLTESCEADLPCLITHVETTSATTQDVEVVDDVHADLAQQDLLPGDHFVDMGYMSSDVLVTSNHHGINLVGPVRADTSWQAQTEGAYDITQFYIDWSQKTVRCPMGKISSYWREGIGKFGKPNVNAGFKPSDCRPCSEATRCTRNKKNKSRSLTFPQKEEYQALQAARERQTTDDFKEQYKTRAGVEGLISQASFALGMRRSRYRGQDKTHFQNIATASAINVLRAINWLMDKPKAKTRISHFAALAA